jgi:hypothetical protein
MSLNCFIYEKKVYANTFPISWIEGNLPGTGYECVNCIYLCSQHGALEDYCANCKENEYEKERGFVRKEDLKNEMKKSNTNPTIGNKKIFDWVASLGEEAFYDMLYLRDVNKEGWTAELPDFVKEEMPIFLSIIDWFDIHYSTQCEYMFKTVGMMNFDTDIDDELDYNSVAATVTTEDMDENGHIKGDKENKDQDQDQDQEELVGPIDIWNAGYTWITKIIGF